MLGRMPSAVGYQPTLATEVGELQERIASTNKGSVTSVQAVYVPADDLTDPHPQLHSPIWMLPPFCPVRSWSRVFTRSGSSGIHFPYSGRGCGR